MSMIHLEESKVEDIYPHDASVNEDYFHKSITLYPSMPYTPSVVRKDVLDDEEQIEFQADESENDDRSQVNEEESNLDDEPYFRRI